MELNLTSSQLIKMLRNNELMKQERSYKLKKRKSNYKIKITKRNRQKLRIETRKTLYFTFMSFVR